MGSSEDVNYTLKLLEQWYCDSCGEIIESVNDGNLEWYSDREISIFKGKGFRIVHNNEKCTYDSNVMFKRGKSNSDGHLNSFIGSDGLVSLLSKFQYERVEDNSELVEIIRRLHIPYYEEARKYHNEAEIDGYFDGENEVTRYITATSKGILNHYNR